ncbi:MAG: acetyl-CoA carboxylase biotin carboxyl carrier protein subunit [Bdellovibrionales bacterium]
MFFEAKVNKTPYKVTVEETRKEWHIALKKESSEEWKKIVLPKKNYQVSDDGSVSLIYNNSSYLMDLAAQGTDYTVYTRGSHRNVSILDDERILRDSLMGGRSLGGQENLKAGMPGKIVKIFVKPGDEIKAGEPLVIMEAMKMENEMKAAEDVIIDRIHVDEGNSIESGALLISFKAK